MITLLSIIAAILLINFVVISHEMGHYIPARYFGRTVKTFSIGFGPELVGYTDTDGTRWKVSAIPLGGYVQFDDEVRQLPTTMGMLGKVSWAGFALITLGGIIVNFLTAWLYIWIFFGKPWGVFEITGIFLHIPTALVETFTNPGSDSTFVGPVGLIDLFSDPKTLIALIPIVSLGLAVTNLIPIPVLDGGAFLFGSIEHIRQKPFSKHTQIWLSAASMGILLALFVASTISDIIRIVT